MQPWARRLVSRLLAVVPAAVIAGLYGAGGVGKLLVGSQGLLSLKLPFAVVPLILITNDVHVMGALANTRAQRVGYWAIAAILIALNGVLQVLLAL